MDRNFASPTSFLFWIRSQIHIDHVVISSFVEKVIIPLIIYVKHCFHHCYCSFTVQMSKAAHEYLLNFVLVLREDCEIRLFNECFHVSFLLIHNLHSKNGQAHVEGKYSKSPEQIKPSWIHAD